MHHVVADEFKIRLAQQVLNIELLGCEQIVQADHVVSLRHKSVAEVGAQKTAPPVTRIRLKDSDMRDHFHQIKSQLAGLR